MAEGSGEEALERMKVLLAECEEKGEKPDERRLFMIARAGRWWDVLEFLVKEKGYDVNGHIEVNMLAEHVALLHGACEEGDVELIECLCERCDADPNARGSEQCTPIMYTVNSGHVDVARMMVERYGADVALEAKWGANILHQAATRGRLPMVKFLVEECGMDPEHADHDGERAVHRAAKDDCLDVLRWLVLSRGVDVNAKNARQETPLHLAAAMGEMDAIKFLVEEADADVFADDQQGRTPSQVAEADDKCLRRMGFSLDDVINFLKSAEEINRMQKQA